MGLRPDYYRALHVRDDAPIEVIRSSYRTLMKTLGAHPDLGGDEGGARALNEAWEILSNPKQRGRYDAERALETAADRLEPEPGPASAGPRPSPAAAEPREPEGADRRAITRLKRDARITWSTEEGPEHSSTIQDLSPRGLSFITRGALERGAPLEIRSEALYARAVVRNIRRLDDIRHLIGVEFVLVHFHDPRGTFVSRSA